MDGGLPNIWRVELFHPLVVHFPIVLLLAGTLAWIPGQLTDDNSRFHFLLPAGRLSLAIGTATAWLAIYTGGIADAEVVRTLCDPTVVEQHENLAYIVAYIFSAAVALDWAAVTINALSPLKPYLTALVGLALLTGSVTLGYVGHLGASLVYQQAAGVYQPSPECTEFE